MKMTTRTREEAFQVAKSMLDGNCINRDIDRSTNAGYDVFTTEKDGEWVSDLGDRLEVNKGGETVNIWIDETKGIYEYQLADALEVINECIYQLDDKVSDTVKNCTGIGEARKLLYGSFKQIKYILNEKYPESWLYAKYNL